MHWKRSEFKRFIQYFHLNCLLNCIIAPFSRLFTRLTIYFCFFFSISLIQVSIIVDTLLFEILATAWKNMFMRRTVYAFFGQMTTRRPSSELSEYWNWKYHELWCDNGIASAFCQLFFYLFIILFLSQRFVCTSCTWCRAISLQILYFIRRRQMLSALSNDQFPFSTIPFDKPNALRA